MPLLAIGIELMPRQPSTALRSEGVLPFDTTCSLVRTILQPASRLCSRSQTFTQDLNDVVPDEISSRVGTNPSHSCFTN